MAPESSPSTSHFTEFTTQKDSFSYTGDVGTQLSAVKKICGVTEDPDLCVDSILPNLKGAVDPVNALQSEINTFVSIASKAIEQIKISMDDPSTSSTASECLQVCLEIYGSAHANLKQAQDAISSHDMDLLKSVLSGAITDLGTCDDAFAESGEELPLDNDLVATMHKLANNCMDISAVLLV
ncbi:Pectinesterase inhibitor domain containing protein [Trema orientale]|uniref:Pectinesterase inhibitor domain containing protein n=1 Tax=Trema orientale TaxID=63057 RepID=A0A2P5DGH9_TREOI|nr:Pectinesterase inhibitor domain containing protein [Trema orientale]